MATKPEYAKFDPEMTFLLLKTCNPNFTDFLTKIVMISAHEGGHTVSCFSAISGRQTAKLGGLTLKGTGTGNTWVMDLQYTSE